MTKYIPDIRTHRWVILAPGRLGKPEHTSKHQIITKENLHIDPDCPFCPGNEKQTVDTIDSIQQDTEWLVRAFPNKYPITDTHEVIAHTPDHLKEIPQMNEKELLNLFVMYQRRARELSKDGVPIIFRNKGVKAGSSIIHPHSQIIVLPPQINLHTLALEPIKNEVIKGSHFTAYCPDFSQFPYEVWITHQNCDLHYSNHEFLESVQLANFNEEELTDVAVLLQKTIIALTKILGEFSYNYYIAPQPPFYLRIIPRTVVRGGFELGTGLSTNIVDPSEAANNLKIYIQ